MKKLLLIVMASILSLLLVGCNKNETVDEENFIDNSQPRDFGLDFSDYVYEGFNDVWGMDLYSTGDYLSGGQNGKRIFYYSNGQIASEGYFKDGHINGGGTGYYPTYGMYVYYITGDNIYEHYIEKPEGIGIEEEPTGWLKYTDICEDGTSNCLWTDYLPAKNMGTEESVVESTTYFENGNLIWIEIGGNRYSADEYNQMSDAKKYALFEIDENDLTYGYYNLSSEKLPFKGEGSLEEDVRETVDNYSIEGQDNEHDIMQYVEAACRISDGRVSENANGESICTFTDDSFCYLNEILEGKCGSDLLWDETQGRLDLWNGQIYCEENGGEVDFFDELCIFDDMSGCDLVDYYYGKCNKGDKKYHEIDDLTAARNKCIKKNGQLSGDEKGNEVCIFEDGEVIPISETFLFGFES